MFKILTKLIANNVFYIIFAPCFERNAVNYAKRIAVRDVITVA